MAITRIHDHTKDWQILLHDYLVANAAKPFTWGTFDCCLFVAGAVQSFTNTDLAADFRGKYTDQAGAMATIKAVTGGTTVESAVEYSAKKYGLTELTPVLRAQRGDIVVYDGEEGVAVGIVHLNGVDCLFVTETGLKKVPLRKMRRAWRVG